MHSLLLAHDGDNLREVGERSDASISSRDVDYEAKAAFREALDAHEHGHGDHEGQGKAAGALTIFDLAHKSERSVMLRSLTADS